jgi:alkylation response protein AidB-like acyl-CoA dehydrogenase
MTLNGKNQSIGCSFLTCECGQQEQFVRESLTADQVALSEVAANYSRENVLPLASEVESGADGVLVGLLKGAGDLGLFRVDLPKRFGGLGLGTVESTVIAESINHVSSFTVAFMCQTGIGMLPLYHYGSEELKERYLGRLANGEMIGGYALTETDAGSDAAAIKTTAKLDGDKFTLDGEKSFCTNGGFADLFSVFTKIDGDSPTAFLVERAMPGVSNGVDRKRMGLHGSSTASVVLSEAQVPKSNMLGEIGQGQRIALGVLDAGRFKLGAACLGGAKRIISLSTKYANERAQFGKPIATFGMIRRKISESVCRTYLLESLIYRIAGAVDEISEVLEAAGDCRGRSLGSAFHDMAVEASIAKIYGSETMSLVADEGVQIHGGYGFLKDYEVERFFRDCRIYRIFEGTNEINRILIPSQIIRRAMKGTLPLLEKFQGTLAALKDGFGPTGVGPYGELVGQVEGIKRLAIYLSGVAMNTLGEGMKDKQSVLAAISEITIDAYVLDSGLSRAIIASKNGDEEIAGRYSKICAVMLARRIPALKTIARQTLIDMQGGSFDSSLPYLKALGRIVEEPVIDADAIDDAIAGRALEHERYNP